jgi:3-oxoacyl-(acyl-carrier-protein) synthase
LDVAIIGVACMVPGAMDVSQFWQNVLAARDSVGEIPRERFDCERWFDQDPKARDKICSSRGGFLPDIPFDPVKFGIPPASLRSIEPIQLLALLLIEQALRDAGYARDNPHAERTGVILGVGGGGAQLGSGYAFRSMLPQFFDHAPEPLLEQLPELLEKTGKFEEVFASEPDLYGIKIESDEEKIARIILTEIESRIS